MKQHIWGKPFFPVLVILIIGITFFQTTHAQPVNDTIPFVKHGDTDSIRPGKMIVLNVKNLEYLLNESDDSRKKPVLFMDDMPIIGLYATFNTLEERASFYLTRTAESREAWDMLYEFGKPVRGVKFSVGWEDGSPVKSNDERWLVVYFKNRVVVVVIFIIIFVVVFIYLAWKTELLRNHSIAPQNNEERRYSLGRCQLAWWFVIVLCCGAFIWVVTGEFPSIPSSVMILLGVTGGTALGGAALDEKKAKDEGPKAYRESVEKYNNWKSDLENKRKEVENIQKKLEDQRKEDKKLKNELELKNNNLKDLEKEREGLDNDKSENGKKKKADLDIIILKLKDNIRKLDDQIQKLASQIPILESEIPKLTDRIPELESLISKQQELINKLGEGLFSRKFLRDILEDKGGAELYRLQIVVWTLVFGLVFIFSSCSQLILKDFDPTILTLMGISSGTYIFLKIPENK